MARVRRNQLREAVIGGLHFFGYGCWALSMISILFIGPIWGGLIGECGGFSYSGCDFIDYENKETIIITAVLASISCLAVGLLFTGLGMTLKQIDIWTRAGGA